MNKGSYKRSKHRCFFLSRTVHCVLIPFNRTAVASVKEVLVEVVRHGKVLKGTSVAAVITVLVEIGKKYKKSSRATFS